MSPLRNVEMPMVSVDLGYVAADEPLAEEVSGWLTDLGESAVDAVLRCV